jgi:hypothetical protein
MIRGGSSARWWVLTALLLASVLAMAQIPGRGRSPNFNNRGFDNRGFDNRGFGGPGGMLPSREDFPTWELDQRYAEDVFTFVRIQYDSYGPFGWWDRWDNDYPDSDWNFSLRLQQLTSLKVNPDSKVLTITDPALLDYPFVYLAGVQYIAFSPPEQRALRRYLLNGGFMMMDDFWSPDGQRNVLRAMQDVLPGIAPVELTIDHEIFHNVYDLKELPQVVDYKTWSSGDRFEYMHSGVGGDERPHFFAYHDQDGRMMAILCHNNDIGDGWEREGENTDYFEQFSVKYSYPLGINIVTYAMTH